MKAFIEWLWRPACIVRSGKDCDRYGKPFDYAVVVVIPWFQFLKWLCGGTAKVTIKGLVSPGTKSLAEKSAHYHAGVTVLEQHRLKRSFERIR